ncbi:MAG: hypothetical protein AB7S38_22655 [Vulcanimicrobiota bacterium]
MNNGARPTSTDWSGRYPANLELLTPDYLRAIPVGPGYGTYYYRATAEPDDFTIFCAGHHHPEVPKNSPSYNAINGLSWPKMKDPRS